MSTGGERDDLFARPLGRVAEFAFDERVAAVFPDMIKRSVPGYETIIAMTGTLAGHYLQPGSRGYDLGCSLGASTLAMARHTADRPRTLVAVDNSPAMIERCRDVLRASSIDDDAVELHCDDILTTPVTGASVVVLNFTLQFVPTERRQELIARIREGLLPGGILVLSEKVRFADPDMDRLMVELHHDFKRAQGYSSLEISQKRDALEQVLLPETLDQHRTRLREAGFTSVDVWFQCFNFASLIAVNNARE